MLENNKKQITKNVGARHASPSIQYTEGGACPSPTLFRIRGFTLVEMLISIAVIAVVGVLGGDILLASIRSYNKSQTINQLTQNGDFALNQMTESIRNASYIVSYYSSSSGAGIVYIDSSGVTQGYTFTNGISGASCNSTSNGSLIDNSTSGYLLNTDTTGSKIATVGIQSGSFVVSSDLKLVTISMTLIQPCSNGIRIDNTATTTLTTTVVVRGGYQ